MGKFEDDRGVIRDLVAGYGCVDSVTEIFTKAGAVRGNHYHEETTQYTYIVRGALLVWHPRGSRIVRAETLLIDRPGNPHAWKALEDTVCLVFTRGPRSGENYEADTYRLEEPLLT